MFLVIFEPKSFSFLLQTNNLSGEQIKPLGRRQREDLEAPESIRKVVISCGPTSKII
jgi:hypothetical protein